MTYLLTRAVRSLSLQFKKKELRETGKMHEKKKKDCSSTEIRRETKERKRLVMFAYSIQRRRNVIDE